MYLIDNDDNKFRKTMVNLLFSTPPHPDSFKYRKGPLFATSKMKVSYFSSSLKYNLGHN